VAVLHASRVLAIAVMVTAGRTALKLRAQGRRAQGGGAAADRATPLALVSN
jgi:hypothetical protein